MHATYAPEQACQAARERLQLQGISVKDWAKQNQLHPSTVYAVLNGQKKCLRGEAHRAAVLLGIKEGVVAQ
jgi:gp16 family phage-associated protein